MDTHDLLFPLTKINGMEKAHPEFQEIYIRFFGDSDADFVRVIKKELTVAEINQRTLNRHNQAVIEWDQVRSRLASIINQVHQY